MYRAFFNVQIMNKYFSLRYGPDLPIERDGEVWDFAEGGPDDDRGRAQRSQVFPSQRNSRHQDQTAKRTPRSFWLPGQSIYLFYQLKNLSSLRKTSCHSKDVFAFYQIEAK